MLVIDPKRDPGLGSAEAVTYTVWAMFTGKQGGVLEAVLDGADPEPAGGGAAGDEEATAAAAVVWELTRAGLARIDGAG